MTTNEIHPAIAISIIFPSEGFYLVIENTGPLNDIKYVDMTDINFIPTPGCLKNKAVKFAYDNIEQIEFDKIKGVAASLFTGLVFGLENVTNIESEYSIAELSTIAKKFQTDNLKLIGPNKINVFVCSFLLTTNNKLELKFPDEPILSLS
jgi:hypothetical protein